MEGQCVEAAFGFPVSSFPELVGCFVDQGLWKVDIGLVERGRTPTRAAAQAVRPLTRRQTNRPGAIDGATPKAVGIGLKMLLAAQHHDDGLVGCR